MMRANTKAMSLLMISLVSTNVAMANDSPLPTRIAGEWTSIACELRPAENRAKPDGAPSSTWLKRTFTYDGKDHFTGVLDLYADPACSVPVVTFTFGGRIEWRGPHPVAAGALKNDYVLDSAFTIMPRAQAFADQLNAMPAGSCGDGQWDIGTARDILGKACALFNIKAGETVKDHDLIWLDDSGDWLFMGAKHVNGQGFYTEDLRPVGGFQVPLKRVK